MDKAIRQATKQQRVDEANGHDDVATSNGHNTTEKERSEATNNGHDGEGTKQLGRQQITETTNNGHAMT